MTHRLTSIELSEPMLGLLGFQFLTFPNVHSFSGHTRDNSFLGFMVKDPEMLNGPVLERENISLLYGKDKHLYKVSM